MRYSHWFGITHQMLIHTHRRNSYLQTPEKKYWTNFQMKNLFLIINKDIIFEKRNKIAIDLFSKKIS